MIPAIRFLASSTKSALGSLYLQCHIKPGASKQREGIFSVSDTLIEVCVAARAEDGAANKAVRDVFSSTLRCPRMNVEILRGERSRTKTILIREFKAEDGWMERITARLVSPPEEENTTT